MYNSKTLNLTFSIINNIVYVKGNTLKDYYYVAPAPLEKRLSYSGSGLPYPNEDVAYDNTKAKGFIKPGNFSFSFEYPNMHYEFNTINLLKPYIKFYMNNDIHHITLGDPLIKNRSLIDLANNKNHSRTTYGGYGSGGFN